MLKNEQQINKIISYLKNLHALALKYYGSLGSVKAIYDKYIYKLGEIVEVNHKTDWHDFTNEEKLTTENLVLSVGLLYQMCKVQLVFNSNKKDELNKINYSGINKSISDANNFISKI